MRFTLLVKLALFVAIVVIFTATLANWIGFHFARESLRDQIHQRLTTVAYGREQRVTAYVNQQRERALLVASRTRLREYLADYLEGTEPEESFRDNAERILSDAKAITHEFLAIWICDPRGRIVATTDEQYFGEDFSQHPDYQQGIHQAHLGTPQETDDGRFEAFLTAPAKTNEDLFLGVVMVLLDVERLVDILQDSQGLGASGEVLVASQEDDRLRYLIPSLKTQELTVAGSNAPAMRRAIEGEIDEEGDQTRTAAPMRERKYWLLGNRLNFKQESLRNGEWSSKSMSIEAFARIASLRKLQWALDAILVIAGALIAIVFAKRFTAPISRMVDTAGRIAGGELRARRRQR